MQGEREDPPPRISTVQENRLLRRPAVGIFLLLSLGFLAYSNTFHVPFVFDDRPSIIENEQIRDLSKFFWEGEGYRYNPRRYVAFLTFAINYRIGGLRVAGYHAFNLAVHLINAILVFSLVRLSFRTPILKKSGLAPSSGEIAFIAALLFAVHPVQTQAVTYIVQRMTSLATLFSIASLCLYARWRLNPESGNPWNKTLLAYTSSLVCLVLAMRTKEIAFTVPVLIALYDRFFFETVKVRFLAPILLTLLIIPAGMLHAGKPVAEVLSDLSSATRVKSELSRGVYLMTQVTVVATYLRLLFLPANQNLDYDYPVAHSFFSGPVLVSFLILVSTLSLGAVLYLRSRPERENPVPEARLASFGIAWFFITLLVESSIIPIADVIFEHRIYLPSVGFFVALSVGVITAGLRMERKFPGAGRAIFAATVLTAVGLAGATFARNGIWTDSVRLWSDVVGKSPRKSRPYYNLAVSHYQKGNVHDAIRNYSMSIRLNPDDEAAHENLGTLYANLGRYDEAIPHYQAALRIAPGFYEARYNLANAYTKMGNIMLAEKEYLHVLDTNPGYGPARNNLGLIYARQGRFEDASAQFRAAVAIDPSDAEAWNNLGIVHARRGDFEQAARTFREALRWGGENAEIRCNLGRAYLALGKPSEAKAEFQAALRIDPGHAGARRGLAEERMRTSENP